MISFNVEFELAFEARLLDDNHRGEGMEFEPMSCNAIHES